MHRLALLIVCALGVLLPYTQYGIVQERVYKQSYGGEVFSEFVFVLFLQTVSNAIFASFVIYFTRQPECKAPKSDWFQVAFTYASATLFSSWALKIVSYPTQLLAKSCKLVPIMLIGWLVHGRRYSVAEFVAVVLITSGVLGYSLSKELGQSDSADTGSSLFGLILLSSSLICDGFTGPKQEALKKHYQPTDMQLMSGTNLYASILLVPVILYLDSVGTVSRFAAQHPEILYDLFMLCVCSTIGQFFVFLTIARFDALQLTIITTVRKFITIVFSIIVYGHQLTGLQFMCVGIVFAGTIYHAHDTVTRPRHVSKRRLSDAEQTGLNED